MTLTKEQIGAAIQVVVAVGDCIRDLGRVPSGELYARMMPHGINVETYTRVIQTLKNAKLVEEKSYELIWIGPKVK